jgi:murein L,D-transpeptidase YcbB/YkuD
MSSFAHPIHLHLRRRRPGRSGRLLAVALVPGAASSAEVVPAMRAAEAQARLVRLGLLDADAATGAWNPSTVEAVRRYQAACGIEPSGVAGPATADRLLLAA